MSKIVYAYVVADLIHVGHLHALENAKKVAGKDGKLIVGVLSDLATMEKKECPIIPFEQRIKMIEALRCVDIAVIQNTYSPLDNVKKIKPNILMESDSHSKEDLAETKKVCDELNCEIMIMPYYGIQSTTSIKKEVKENGKKSNKKN